MVWTKFPSLLYQPESVLKVANVETGFMVMWEKNPENQKYL